MFCCLCAAATGALWVCVVLNRCSVGVRCAQQVLCVCAPTGALWVCVVLNPNYSNSAKESLHAQLNRWASSPVCPLEEEEGRSNNSSHSNGSSSHSNQSQQHQHQQHQHSNNLLSHSKHILSYSISCYPKIVKKCAVKLYSKKAFLNRCVGSRVCYVLVQILVQVHHSHVRAHSHPAARHRVLVRYSNVPLKPANYAGTTTIYSVYYVTATRVAVYTRRACALVMSSPRQRPPATPQQRQQQQQQQNRCRRHNQNYVTTRSVQLVDTLSGEVSEVFDWHSIPRLSKCPSPPI